MGACCSNTISALCSKIRLHVSEEEVELSSRDAGRCTDPPLLRPTTSLPANLTPEERVMERDTVAPLGGLDYSTLRKTNHPAYVPNETRVQAEEAQTEENVTPRSHRRAHPNYRSSRAAPAGLGVQVGRPKHGGEAPPEYDASTSTIWQVIGEPPEHNFEFGFEQSGHNSNEGDIGLVHMRAEHDQARPSFLEPAPDTPTPAPRPLQPSTAASDRSLLPSERRRRNEAREPGLTLNTDGRLQTLQGSSGSRRRLPVPSFSPRPVSDGFLLASPRIASPSDVFNRK